MNYSPTGTPDSIVAGANQAGQEAWAGKTWTIAAVSMGLEELQVNGSLPQFQLERQPGSGPAVYALRSPQQMALPQCFAASVLLTQRGAVPPTLAKRDPLLQAPFVMPHEPYWDASEEVINDSRDLLRLEGVIQMSDGPNRIVLYQVNNVLTGDKALLVIDIKSTLSKANTDGTCIGHN